MTWMSNWIKSKTEITKLYKNIRFWYKLNSLNINTDKTKAMLIGGKAQHKSLNANYFILSNENTLLELVKNAQYIGMF